MSLLDDLKPKGEWDSKNAFWIYVIWLSAFGTAIFTFILKSSLRDVFPAVIPKYFYLSPLLLPLVYTIIFLIKRSWLDVLISKKANIVIAFNLSSCPEFSKEYSNYINELRNKINNYELGDKVKIIEKPKDLEFDRHTAAEAKTKLSLTGSTLLIWGSATKRNNKYKFNTKFSYEFLYPKNIREKDAQTFFNKIISKGLDGGLYRPDNFEFSIDQDIFSDDTLAVSLFILGCTTASCGYHKQAMIFYEKFIEMYKKTDLIHKRKMGPALMIAKENLKRIRYYLIDLNLYNDKQGGNNPDKIKEDGEYLLNLDKYDYFGNLHMAYYYELVGDRILAKEYNDMAKLSSPKNFHNHLFNDAYFCISEGEYSKAIKKYGQIPLITNVNTGKIREYLFNRYKTSNNLAYLFADALVAIKWHSEVDGKKILKDLLKNEDFINSPEYSILKYEVIKLV